MNPPETNDPLDALLREQNTYIEDNGFIAQVMSKLPARRRHSWLRCTILLGATVIGGIMALWWIPWNELVVPTGDASLSQLAQVGFSYATLLAVAGSLLWGSFAAIKGEE